MSDDDNRWFHTTQWTMVLDAGAHESDRNRAALERLCETYWRPLYCYARQRGSAEEEAKDLTQGFFENLLEKDIVSHADRERGKFRSFLLTAMKNFLSNEHRRATAEKRGGGRQALSIDNTDGAAGETLYLSSASDHLTPDRIFDKTWAIATLEEAMLRLQEDYKSRDQGELFRRLRLLLWDDDTSATYADLGTDLGMSEAAVKMAVKRLRQRAREQLRREVANTVAEEDDVDSEYRYLREVLQG